MRKALTIAGSDSGGGAGIQADLKTFAALGVYGASALTAVTAQNTLGVTGVVALDAAFVGKQIDAVMDDIGADAAKTGMVANAPIIRVIAERVRHHGLQRLVVDPVMVAASGDRLLEAEAEEALRQELLPLALVATPNLDEARVLTGKPVGTVGEMREAARQIREMGCRAVLVKGGHLQGDPVDVLLDEDGFAEFTSERIATPHTHGSGCTYAAAIAARLAKGDDLRRAVAQARQYLTEAIRQAFPVGGGTGPVHHLHPWVAAPGMEDRA